MLATCMINMPRIKDCKYCCENGNASSCFLELIQYNRGVDYYPSFPGGSVSAMEEQVTQEFLQLMEEKRRLQKRQSKLLLK